MEKSQNEERKNIEEELIGTKTNDSQDQKDDEIKIREVINIKKKDLYNYNIYLASLNKNLGLMIASIVIIFIGIYGLISEKGENLFANILIMGVGCFGLLMVFVISKLIIKSKIKKLKMEDMAPIEVILSEKGIVYKYIEETDNGSDFVPFGWNLVGRAVIDNNYIYIHMIDRRTILFIKLSDLSSDTLVNYLEGKLKPLKRFLDKRQSR